MPGRLLQLTPQSALGWAAHPRLVDYRVVVNMIHRATVVRSVLAELRTAEADVNASIPCGFRFDLTPLDLTDADVSKLRFVIGETDEWIETIPEFRPVLNRRLTVEDLLQEAHRPRLWIDGTTYLDAEAAGLRVETIIDLLYRDYLGRPSDPNGLAHYSAAIHSGAATYDDVRRGFVEADEFRLRRKYPDNAPGSIFSQKLVMAVASRDCGQPAMRPPSGHAVVASELAKLDGRVFVSEVYRRILMKEADEGGMAHYLHQLHLGVGKMDVIRTIAGELEAITAGVRVIGYDHG